MYPRKTVFPRGLIFDELMRSKNSINWLIPEKEWYCTAKIIISEKKGNSHGKSARRISVLAVARKQSRNIEVFLVKSCPQKFSFRKTTNNLNQLVLVSSQVNTLSFTMLPLKLAAALFILNNSTSTHNETLQQDIIPATGKTGKGLY